MTNLLRKNSALARDVVAAARGPHASLDQMIAVGQALGDIHKDCLDDACADISTAVWLANKQVLAAYETEIENATASETSVIISNATRIFYGPNERIINNLKVYAVVAFKSMPTKQDNARYEMICDAYVSSLLPLLKDADSRVQIVTVWPIALADKARSLNASRGNDVCKEAVQHYGLASSQLAIRNARDAILATHGNITALDGQGPFLLAWSPGAAKGNPGAMMLRFDMSDVMNLEQAKRVFAWWTYVVQSNPQLWSLDGWNESSLKIKAMLWADKWGTYISKIRGESKADAQ